MTVNEYLRLFDGLSERQIRRAVTISLYLLKRSKRRTRVLFSDTVSFGGPL